MTMTVHSTTVYRLIAAHSLSPEKSLAQLTSAQNLAVTDDTVILSSGQAAAGAAGNGTADPVSDSQAPVNASGAAGNSPRPFSSSINHEIKRSGEGYKAEATYPEITGGPAEEVRAIINRLIEAEVTSAVNDFETDAKGTPPHGRLCPERAHHRFQ